MKKKIAAAMLAMAVGASVNAFAESTTFTVDSTTPPSGATTAVTEIPTNIAGMTMKIGADTWSFKSASTTYNGISYTGSICGATNPKPADGIGTYYEFIFDDTIADGTLEVMYQVNSGKNLYITDNDVPIDGYNGITYDTKVTQSTTFNVSAGHDYKLYATGTKVSFYGCTYKVVDKQKDFEDEIQGLTFDVIKGNNTDENHIDSDLKLIDNYPSQFGSCDVSWTSSDESVIDNSGVVNAQSEDRVVTFTGKFSVQEDNSLVQYKVFTLTVPGDTDDAGAVTAAKEALTLGDISAVKKDIELPSRGKRGTEITWSTSDESVVTADGVVTRAPGQDKTATLTATLTRGAVSETKNFDVTVLGYVPVTIDTYVYGDTDGTTRFSPVDGGTLKHISFTSSIKEPEDGDCVIAAVYDKDGRITGVKAAAITAEDYDTSRVFEVDLPMNSSDTFEIMALNLGTLVPYIEKVQPNDTVADGATIYVIGDSTAAVYDDSRYPRTGWAQVLQNYFDDVKVVDLALSGRSSLSFKNDTNFKTFKENIKAGDYLIVQFGHNDDKTDDRHTDPSTDRFTDGSFKKSMLEYIEIARDKGATPIIATSISRRKTSDTSLEKYVAAAKELGEETDVPVLDLYAKTNAYINEVGVEEAKSMFNWVKVHDSRFVDYEGYVKSQYYNATDSDDTHININGADLISQYATEEMARIGMPLAEKVNDHKAVYPLPSYTTATSVE